MNKSVYCLFYFCIFWPCACYGSGQSQINWLSLQQNQSTGLVDSYESDGTDRAYLYDQGLSIIAFTAAGEYSKARLVLTALQNLQQSNGVWYECYDTNTTLTPEGLRLYNTGPISWVVAAMNFYQGVTSDSNYAASANAALNWLENLAITDPCSEKYGAIRYCSGPDCVIPQAVSTEHNADAHSAFYWRGVLEGNGSFMSRADLIGAYLAREMWGQSDNQNCNFDADVFWRGFEDCQWCTDCQSWTTLSLGPFGPGNETFHNSMDWIWFSPWGNTRLTQDFSDSILNVDGFKSCTDETNDYVWTEVTEGVAVAYYSICDWQKGDYFHSQISKVVSANGGVPHSFSNTNPQTIRWPDNWRFNGVAATCWYYLAENKINPFDISSFYPSLAADSNYDKSIDFRDYSVLSNDYGNFGLAFRGDLNNDCRTDALDLILFAEHWLEQIN
jgi:hypothetical protein